VSCARGDRHSSTICCAAATCSAGTVMVSTCSQQQRHAYLQLSPAYAWMASFALAGLQRIASLMYVHMPLYQPDEVLCNAH
jgi:hypothetical protein